MKKGWKGYRSNCDTRFEIWGIASGVPIDYGVATGGAYHNPYAPYGVSYPYTKNYDSGASVQINKDIIPELFEVQENRSFPAFAAKVPSSYPGAGCEKHPITSSKEDDSWKVSLDPVSQQYKVEATEITPEVEDLSTPRYFFCSRAIYIDGVQKYLGYSSSGGSTPGAIGRPNNSDARNMSDYYIVNIDEQTLEVGPVRTGDFDSNRSSGTPPFYSLTQMERNVIQAFFDMPTITGGYPEVITVLPVNSFCIGKEYLVFSTYTPTGTPASNPWSVGRIKYNGTRPEHPIGNTGSTIESFCSPYQSSEPPSGGLITYPGDVGLNHEGEFAIVLPSCRTYIDSSVITEENPTDECWVCAMRTYGSPKLITSQWLSKVYRSTSPSNDINGSADGTLSSGEVAAANTIVDADDPTLGALFPGETWDNLMVRCYNRVYNPTTGHSSDLLLFTTSGTPHTGTPLADFSDGGGGFDASYIDGGLDDFDLSWTTYGTSGGDRWIAVSDDYRPGSTDNRSAFANINAVNEGTTDMEITVNVTTEAPDNFSFWFKFDNRRSGERQPGFPFTELTNFPEVDHSLTVYVDGSPATVMIDYGSAVTDSPGPQPYTHINNNKAKVEETAFINWYQGTITLEAGTHNIRFSVNRQWQDGHGHLLAWVDDIQFPELLLGDDISGAKRWYYDGTRVRKASYWAWARRNEEGTSTPGHQDPVASRASTVPDFITMDSEGRILYGNPHYVAVIRMDDGHEGELDTEFGGPKGGGIGSHGGYIRFTATPNHTPENPPCDEPAILYPTVDEVTDPPWGAFQILPTKYGFQVRGANADARDATDFPIPTEIFTYKDPRTGEVKQEQFKNLLYARYVGLWNNRPHSWTIGEDGKKLVPHLETVWRPTMHQMAWPEAPDSITGDYPVPPYRADFDTTDYTNPDFTLLPNTPGIVRWRNSFFLDPDDPTDRVKAQWALINYIVPATYSDTFSQLPQSVWVRVTDDPPQGLDGEGNHDPDWYIPAGPLPNDPGEGTIGMPWGSARWKLVQARFCPTGGRWIFYQLPHVPGLDPICPDIEDPDTTENRTILQIYLELGTLAGAFVGSPDFDAIYDSCDCCG